MIALTGGAQAASEQRRSRGAEVGADPIGEPAAADATGRTSPRAMLVAAAQFVARVAVVALSGLLFWSVAPLLLGWHSAVVLTGSMQPAISPGDVVVYDTVQARDLEVGEVAVVLHPNSSRPTVVHRVDARSANGTLTLRGDANVSLDSTALAADARVGRARLRIVYVGLPAVWRRAGQMDRVAAGAAAVVVLLVLSKRRRRDWGHEPEDPDADEGRRKSDVTIEAS